MSTEPLKIEHAISILGNHRNGLIDYAKAEIAAALETVRRAYDGEWCQDSKGNWYLSLRRKTGKRKNPNNKFPLY
jgi:hypothetical protein